MGDLSNWNGFSTELLVFCINDHNICTCSARDIQEIGTTLLE